MLLGATNAGSSVYASRVRPLISNGWQRELPAIIVYTMDEAGEIFNQAPREYRRRVELVVEIHAEGNDALDDTLDTLLDKSNACCSWTTPLATPSMTCNTSVRAWCCSISGAVDRCLSPHLRG